MTVDFAFSFLLQNLTAETTLLFQKDTVFKNTDLVYMNMYLVVYKSPCLSLTVHSPVRNTFQPPLLQKHVQLRGSLGLGGEVQLGAFDSYSVISSYVSHMAKRAVEWWCTCRPNRDINLLFCSLDQVIQEVDIKPT